MKGVTLVARLVLAALSCYRLSELAAMDDGPADVFLKVRMRGGAYDRDEQGRVTTSLGKLLGCPYCLGYWFAALCVMLVVFPTRPGDLFLMWNGVAGAQARLQGPRT